MVVGKEFVHPQNILLPRKAHAEMKQPLRCYFVTVQLTADTAGTAEAVREETKIL